MGIEYNECHYCGMYNVYVKRIFVITEFVHMNEKTGTGVSSKKEKVKESQSTKCDTLARHPHRVPGWGVTKTMHAYFTKDIYIYKMSHFNFYYFYFTPYLID